MADAKKGLGSAQTNLRSAQGALSGVSAAAARATTDRIDAETAMAEVQGRANVLLAALADAEKTKEARSADHATAVTLWEHERRVAVAAAAAENGFRASCRGTGRTTIITSGLLGLLALALAGWNVCGGRRETRPA